MTLIQAIDDAATAGFEVTMSKQHPHDMELTTIAVMKYSPDGSKDGVTHQIRYKKDEPQKSDEQAAELILSGL